MDEETYNKRMEKAKLSKQRSFQRKMNRLKSSEPYMVRDALNEVRFSNRSGSMVNLFAYHKQNTDAHEDMKYKVYKALIKMGSQVLVEPIFINGARADILDCSRHIIFEVVCTETEKRLAAKENYYPSIFEIRKIEANKPLDEGELL